MYRFLYFLLILLSISELSIPPSSSLSSRRVLLQNSTVTSRCPLNFDALRRLALDSIRLILDTRSECQLIRQDLRLVFSEYLWQTDSFLPPPESAGSCWDAYDALVNGYVSNFDIRRRCGFRTEWIARGCMNLITRSNLEAAMPRSALDDVVSVCNQPLLSSSPYATCTTALSNVHASYLPGPCTGNVSDCTAYPFIYVAAFGNHFGPSDEGTSKCLFNLDFTSSNSSSKWKEIVIIVAVVLILGISSFWFLRRRKNARLIRQKLNNMNNNNINTNVSSGLDSLSASTTLIQFTFDEIKTATKNFSRDSLIGKGGYCHALALEATRRVEIILQASRVYLIDVVTFRKHSGMIIERIRRM